MDCFKLVLAFKIGVMCVFNNLISELFDILKLSSLPELFRQNKRNQSFKKKCLNYAIKSLTLYFQVNRPCNT